MYTAEKYKIWDTETNTWFKPTYPGNKPGKNNKIITTFVTREIMFSMAGDLFMHDHSPDIGTTITDLNLIPHFIPCVYTSFKDCHGKKIYKNDVLIDTHNKIIGVVASKYGCFYVQNKDGEIVEYLCDAIKSNASYFGNILETPNILS